MKIAGNILSRKVVRAGWVLSAIVIFIAGKNVYDYAAPPMKEKECNFIYPGSSDQAGPSPSEKSAPANPVPLFQKGGVINDASCLNQTAIYGIVKIATIEDIQNALKFARENHLKVTSAGQRHSMGGQTFSQGGLVLDMRNFNHFKLDREHQILNTESGAKWTDIQRDLDKEGLSVKAMQSINIFTVGGTLSVNAHGVAHNPGQIAPTVKSFRIMLSNGEIKNASPVENSELFRMALGGYGLVGVILDVDLDLVKNEIYRPKIAYIDYKAFPDYFKKNILDNDQIGLIYGRLSVSPASYLTETAVHFYTRTKFEGDLPPLKPEKHAWLYRLIINFSKTGDFGRRVRWLMEKYAEPAWRTCSAEDPSADQKERCIVSRNQEMYDSMGYLRNRLHDTDILQEYFIPMEKMPDFVDGLRKTVKETGANLINVTIRIVQKDTITALPYAKEDRFAFVLYFNQKLNEKESLVLRKTTADLIDLAISLGGRYYLPYQLYYSKEQLHKAYPEIDAFFEAKRRYDPNLLFSNQFYEKYGQ